MTTEIRPPAAHQRPSGRMYLTTNQLNLVHGVTTVVELNTIAAGFTDGIENTVNHRITPGQAGFYSITGTVTFLNVVVGHAYRTYILISGTSYVGFSAGHASVADLLSVSVSGLVKLTATDYIHLSARSLSGDDTVDIYSGPQFTYLCVQRVR